MADQTLARPPPPAAAGRGRGARARARRSPCARAAGTATSPPATGAARVVPADALVYIHLSTDPDRDAVRQALELAERFPGFPRLRDGALGALSRRRRPESPSSATSRPWLGDEAALALLNTTGETRGLAGRPGGHRPRARPRRFLERRRGPAAAPELPRHGRLAPTATPPAAFVGRLPRRSGRPPSVRAGHRRRGGPRALAGRDRGLPAGHRDLPDGRVADAYASPDGVARLLAVPGRRARRGRRADRPARAAGHRHRAQRRRRTALRGASCTASSTRRSPSRCRAASPSSPSSIGSVPEDAMAYLGLTRLDRAGGRLLAAGLAGGGAGTPDHAAARSRPARPPRRAGVDLERDVLPLLQGEVALWLAPAIPAPVLTLIASDRRRGRARARRSRASSSRSPGCSRPRGAARCRRSGARRGRRAGVPAAARRRGRARLRGRSTASSSCPPRSAGVARGQAARGSLADNESFDATLGGRPDEGHVASLPRLQPAAAARRAHGPVRQPRPTWRSDEDLRKVKAVGAAATGRSDSESTTELFIEIP